jgi:hypothetical protein
VSAKVVHTKAVNWPDHDGTPELWVDTPCDLSRNILALLREADTGEGT